MSDEVKDDIKIFGKWSNIVEVNDYGLKPYVNLKQLMIPRSAGVPQKRRFHKSDMHIVERLVLHLMRPGHSGKKHRITSGSIGGNYSKVLKIVEDSFKIIEEKTKENPLAIFVKALENAAVREEITSFQMGGMMARSAVVTSPQRRVDHALRLFAQGTYKRTFGKKTSAAEALSTEIIEAYNNTDKSLAVSEKLRLEREASSSR
ncbi:MAG: 30S ribosomal protein S7 [Candidatus Aenigmatarchaeota archaeon]